jgi:hypothetical protein
VSALCAEVKPQARLYTKLTLPNFKLAVCRNVWHIKGAGGGRTGFDLKDALEAACRGRFVGLVKNRTKNKC